MGKDFLAGEYSRGKKNEEKREKSFFINLLLNKKQYSLKIICFSSQHI
ncbi:hypothetical protein ACERII_04405 [Evansella sp. AB-rgal1]